MQNITELFDWFVDYWWVVLLAIIPGLATWAYRHTRSYKQYLAPELEKFGLTYISEEALPPFDTGPFPKTVFHGVRKTRMGIAGISGQWASYRLVYYADENGNQMKSWVWLQFEAFRLVNIRWNPTLTKHKNKRKSTD